MNEQADAAAYGRSWYAATMLPVAPRPPLAVDLDVDVAVIGGGLAGLTAAREVLEEELPPQPPQGEWLDPVAPAALSDEVADEVAAAVAGARSPLVVTSYLGRDPAAVAEEVTARDREVANRFSKDGQITAIRAARGYLGDRLGRVVAPHRLADPKAGPLIAVKLHILTRKTLGGLETDLDSRVLKGDGTPLDGLYAAGEVAGFGGGGVHGYRALEGTFLGGCIFSGRAAGRGAANDIA